MIKKYPHSFFIITLLLMFSQTASATEPIVTSKQMEISLDSLSSASEARMDLSQLVENMPEQCRVAGVTCLQKSRVKVILENTWIPISISSLTNPQIPAPVEARAYPALDLEQTLGPGSPAPAVAIAQRILYDARLLSELPTGKYGFATERAVVRLQQRVGFAEIDRRRGVAIIGPRTAKVLNGLWSGQSLDGMGGGALTADDARWLKKREISLSRSIRSTPRRTPNTQSPLSELRPVQATPFPKLTFDGEIIVKK